MSAEESRRRGHHPLRKESGNEYSDDHHRPAGPAERPDDRSASALRRLIFRANLDDDVKVLVIRGIGDHLGTGADLDELMAKRQGHCAL